MLGRVLILSYSAATLAWGCGGESESLDDSSAGAAGASTHGGSGGSGGNASAGTGESGGGSSGGSRAGASAVGGAASGGAGAGGGGGSSEAGEAGDGSSGAAAGGSEAGAGGTGGLVVCDPRLIVCRRAAPVCSEGEVPSVSGTCYGACVPIERCECDEPAACPNEATYTCHNSAGRCGPYVR
jgi:hypothetical protein